MAINQAVLNRLANIEDKVGGIDTKLDDQGLCLKEHITAGKETDKKTDLMYKVVVVDNGNPTLVNKVDMNTNWRNNANKFGWIVITVFVGQFVVSLCGLVTTILIFLMQQSGFQKVVELINYWIN